MTKIEPAGPDPLIAVIRRNFETATSLYGIEPPGDIGVLLREIRRLEGSLAESTKIECNCSGKSYDTTPATGPPSQIRHLIEHLTEDGGEHWVIRELETTDGYLPMLSSTLHTHTGDALTINVGGGPPEVVDRILAAEGKVRDIQDRIRPANARVRMLTAHVDTLVRLLNEFALAGVEGGCDHAEVRQLLAQGLKDPGFRDQFLNRDVTDRQSVGVAWFECPTGNCRHSVFMHDTSGPEPWCRAEDCHGEAAGAAPVTG